MVELLFASHNLGKVGEVRSLLAPFGISVRAADFDVAETGNTFAANAQLKAEGFAAKVAQPTWVLADDSGLSVDALNGEPGVNSKRFVSGSDHDRNQAILKMLANFPDPKQRRAHFTTVFCLYQPEQAIGQQLHFFEGQVQGRIAQAEKGSAGFGYDAVFIPDGYQQTFGELGQEVKNQLSHRSQAIKKLVTYLQTL